MFVHEFTHTQSVSFGAQVDALVEPGLPDDSDDDVIQSRFGDLPGFKATYEPEQEARIRRKPSPGLLTLLFKDSGMQRDRLRGTHSGCR